jgi:serine/threonine-protein kinase RsbW
MERFFPRSIDSLDGIFQFVSEYLDAEEIEESNSFAMNMMFEELFTNMVKYSPESNEEIRLAIDREENQLILSLTDFDVEPFDITQAREVDVNQPLSERRPGGLGIHFVKQLADSISYEYKDRSSTIMLKKRLES